MGGMRVTQQMLTSQALFNLNQHTLNLLDLQDQLSSGQRINRSSDDPLAVRRAVGARLELSQDNQYLTNISTARPMLQDTETALTASVDILQRAKELALQGASGTNGQTQRESIAMEINELLGSLVQEGNYVSNGRYVFAGTYTNTLPFAVTTDADGEITQVDYEGNDEHFSVEIAKGVHVEQNVTGQQTFLTTVPGTVDLFQTLIDIRDHLRAGDTNALGTDMESLDSGLEQLLTAEAKVGAISNRMDRTESALEEVAVQVEEVISDNVDADLAEVITRLNAENNAYQASLSATARVIQLSLLDYVS